MDENKFWAIVDASRNAAGQDALRHIEALREALTLLAPNQIAEFDQIMMKLSARAYSWLLWGAAYLIWDGCSDDGFTDFRTWLISKGKNFYESAVDDPDSLAGLISTHGPVVRNEEFATVAFEIWQEKTGESIQEYVRILQRAEPVRQGPDGVEWQDKDLPYLLPKLAKKYRRS